MKKYEAIKIIEDVFEHKFNPEQYKYFIKNLLKSPEENQFLRTGYNIFRGFEDFIASYERFFKFSDLEGNEIDILAVKLKKEFSIYHARSKQRNFVKKYLVNKERDAALVAFYSENSDEWRFSFIKMQYSLAKKKDELTPAKRYSFLVGEKGKTHTAKTQIIPILQNDNTPSMDDLEEAFNVETVSDEFFEKYKELVFRLKDKIEIELNNNQKAKDEFDSKNITIMEFAKKLLGQIVFIYFLQKKGWLGCKEEEPYGEGDKNFLRSLFDNRKIDVNFYSEYLEYLFYEALSSKRVTDFYQRFNCKIPFLNGGLFDPINFYDWQKIKLILPNELFSNKSEANEEGNGILDVFDRYNFTVKEDEPLEKEVAVDPEMLGKAFERMLPVKDRKSKGAFYTPREIVHYMSQESLINYLDSMLNKNSKSYEFLTKDQLDFFGNEGKEGQLDLVFPNDKNENILKNDIEYFIHFGENIKELDKSVTGVKRNPSIPESVSKNADIIDVLLRDIRVCDPAVGSGAFPVGIMNEIVKARELLNSHITNTKLNKNRDAYHFKLNAIDNCIYGVDTDKSAVEICKLRLWLSLVVDEERIDNIDPLPNLGFKIVSGNSLLHYPYTPQGLDKIVKEKARFQHETDKKLKQEELKKINLEFSRFFKNSKQALGYEINFDYKINFSEVFAEKNGFDVVIGNPPYYQIQKLKEQEKKDLKKQNFVSFTRTGDLYCLFYELGSRILNNKGIHCFITSNKWMRANYGKKLREFLAKETNPKLLIDFGGYKVFSTATVDTNILLYKNEEHPNVRSSSDCSSIENQHSEESRKYSGYIPKLTACAVKPDFHKNTDIASYIKNNNVILSDLSEESWIISTKEEFKIKQRIEEIGTPLKDWDVSINYGIKTGFNEAFIISGKKKDELIAQDPKSAEIIKPILRGRDIKRYKAEFADLWLINSHNGFKDKDGNKIERINIEDYPAIKEHLEKYWDKISVRYDKGDTPYNLRNCAYMVEFEKEKIVYNDINQKLSFSLVDAGFYFINTAYFIANSKFNKFFLGMLNSVLYDWYYRQISAQLGERAVRMFSIYVLHLTIPEIPEEKQKPFEKLVDMILFCKENEKEMEINPLYSAYFEQVIDGMVFELYFEKELKSAERDILQHLGELPELTDEMSDNEKLQLIKATFNRLYKKEHPVRKNLFLMDSIEEIRIIKGLDK